MPFGGAGPLHATALAAQLGIERILCPRACGVLSALGLAAAALRAATRPAPSRRRASSALLARARAQLGAEPRARARAATRFATAASPSSSPSTPPPDAARTSLRERFEAAHEREFGYRDATRRSSW